MKADGKNVEVLFVSSDRDNDSFKEYFSEMPWLALDFE
jgi:nucleoredoxin